MEEGTDPWDPDFDDDGLTDGQELKGISKVTQGTTGGFVSFTEFNVREANILEEPTDPLNPDTDDDGYWDGWIGVHGVEYSDNVILYREHLRDEDDTRTNHAGNTIYGIRGAEIVEEQVGLHEVSSSQQAAPWASARIDGKRYHSNIHVGELHWGTDPNSNGVRGSGSTPHPSLSVEVDFSSRSRLELNRSEWERGIEQNYRLYGIDVDIMRDEIIPRFDSGLDSLGLEILAKTESSPEATDYLFVAEKGDGMFTSDSGGINLPIDRAMALFTDGEGNTVSKLENGHTDLVKKSTYTNGWQLRMANLALHEIAHSLQIGRADDDYSRAALNNGEIYSGRTDSVNDKGDDGLEDRTPERIQRNGDAWWSIMVSGYNPSLIHEDSGVVFYAFSIEELLTTRTP
ncbi:hypothetical protein HTIA_2393 [Halorhabdus tiamatea SARL4B]|uniref:Uncharacterized protein n=1 Tax=Halorhabdus tiamatea SARL4B TaxID=1033806 RepID=S6D931_9EURY|nr:hypothetical protein HTIA_2393 [Halorhabdus tiamatea SARL4B]